MPRRYEVLLDCPASQDGWILLGVCDAHAEVAQYNGTPAFAGLESGRSNPTRTHGGANHSGGGAGIGEFQGGDVAAFAVLPDGKVTIHNDRTGTTHSFTVPRTWRALRVLVSMNDLSAVTLTTSAGGRP